MADSIFMFVVTTAIFVFLMAILFGSRAHRRRGSEVADAETKLHSYSSSGSAGKGRRIKKFRSDGTLVSE